MNETNTYQAVRIGDIADWRLICYISSSRMCAYLKHINPTEDIVTLFDERWKFESDSLLKKIENIVYDHPQILDDFTASVVINTPKSLWVPSRYVDDDEDEAYKLYNQVYEAEEIDIMTENVGNSTCLYTLVPGLNAFLQRTFPGARLHSHQAVMVDRFKERSSDMLRVYIDIRKNEADFISFDKTRFLTASTHNWRDINDIQYHLFNIMSVYGLNPEETQVSLSGIREVKNELLRQLRKTISFVMLTIMPSIGTKAGMPVPAAMLIRV